MRDEMDQFLRGWKVRSIEVLPEKRGVEVTFQTEGHDPVRFRTRKFGIGRRGVRSAALAKFAAQAGYGSVEDVFRYVSGLPSDMVGGIFQTGPLGLEAAQPPVLHCVWPEEAVA
jgi:hypothetical protein